MREIAAVRIWTGQFNIIDGDVREEGPNVASFEGRATDGDQATLYVLAEPALPASEPLVGEMVQAIGHLFRQQDVSLTGNLLRSLRGAHESLYQWNQENDRSVWSAAGCSAAVVRGQDVYLSQCGPAVAYYRGGGVIKQIAPDSAARPAIGVADHFRPSLTRHALGPGDTLLLSHSVLRDLSSDDQIGETLALTPEDALPQLYMLAKAQQEFSLLLLAGLAAPAIGGEPAGHARPRTVPAPPSRRNPFGR